MSLKEIMSGWKHTILPTEKVEELAKIRLQICQECPYHSTNAKKGGYTSIRPDDHCTQCGCPLLSKTRCPKCECPEKKWLADDSI